MTGGTKNCRVFSRGSRLPREAERAPQTHTHVFLSLSLITADIYTEGQGCKMPQHFKRCHTLASSEDLLLFYF